MKLGTTVETTALTCMRLGATRVALPTHRVARVEAASDTEIAARGDAIDLAVALGLPAGDADSGPFVLLWVTGIEPAFRAALPLSVVEVRAESVHALPDYVAPWGRAHGLAGVVVEKQALTFLLDADLVHDRHQRSAHGRAETNA